MNLDWLLEKFSSYGNATAIVWQEQQYTYNWFIQAVSNWRNQVQNFNILSGEIIAVDADYSPEVCALLIALIENNNVVVPLTSAVQKQKEEFIKIAQVQGIFEFENQIKFVFYKTETKIDQPLLLEFIDKNRPGLVLFSSGSTGKSKAALHDFSILLEKFNKTRHSFVTIAFLLLDHIGGINTLFYTLANGGTLVCISSRLPQEICRYIEQYKVKLLPTSPTFLNLLLLSEEYNNFDLSSLELITYGTEVMLESTLKRLNEIFPNTRLLQTYGLSEIGILSSKSKDSESLWVKLGGEGYELKIVDNILWIKAKTAMIGYLNAPSPFDEEGWLNTGDLVEVDGEYLKILGRKSEIINVGGQKVYPSEVESVLLQMDNIADVTVKGESNPLVGNIVVARVNLRTPEEPSCLKKRIREYCQDKLESFKIPVKVEIADQVQYSGRFKRMRRKEALQ